MFGDNEPAAVLARHRLAGSTKFSHHGGSSYVEWPRCGCGAQMHPNLHPQHLLDVLTEAGFAVTPTAVEVDRRVGGDHV